MYKIRRCFLYNNQYFQLDIYKDPCHERCKVNVFYFCVFMSFDYDCLNCFLQGLMLLETYTTLSGEELKKQLPSFLNIGEYFSDSSLFFHHQYEDFFFALVRT